jgi:hypothetical protein
VQEQQINLPFLYLRVKKHIELSFARHSRGAGTLFGQGMRITIGDMRIPANTGISQQI